MKAIYRLFSIFISVVFFVSPCFSEEENFLLTNGVTDEIVMSVGPSIDTQMSPCSTFKIILSLMGYDAAILKDEISPTWGYQEGYENWLSSWRAPQSPQSWMKHSCIWYSKILSLELGLEKIQSYLTAFRYGNRNMSGGLTEPGPLDPAWVNSSLKVSPKEQVDFITKMIRGQLPISSHAIHMTKMLLFKEELPEGWKLFGKTGWSGSDVARDGETLEHRWFVGWIEKDDRFFPFAYLIRGEKIDLNQAIPRVKKLLSDTNYKTGNSV